uniref:Uncharacterized protein n=1 Tax=Physcomitrium patens TaxID=3218 RepID=A0A7I4BHC7_PHYPA
MAKNLSQPPHRQTEKICSDGTTLREMRAGEGIAQHPGMGGGGIDSSADGSDGRAWRRFLHASSTSHPPPLRRSDAPPLSSSRQVYLDRVLLAPFILRFNELVGRGSCKPQQKRSDAGD